MSELTDHLGNIRAVVSGKGVVGGVPTITMATDYYPFGMEMPQRSFSTNTYRFNYNGKEIDRETGLEDYGFRIYDPKVCRFLSVDPLTKKYPELTPYQFASNSPIMNIDIDGLEGFNSITMQNDLFAAYRADPAAYKKTLIRTVAYTGSVMALSNPYTFALGYTSLGLMAGKDIARAFPSKFNQNMVEKTPESFTGVLSFSAASFVHGNAEMAGKRGDFGESLVTTFVTRSVFKFAEVIESKNIPGLTIGGFNTVQAIPSSSIQKAKLSTFTLDPISSSLTISNESSSSYKVRKGDTLTGLAKRFGASVDAIAKENNIDDKNKIFTGQSLQIK